ncbi:hypothetical protein RYX36_026747 [Vicia faba]
MSSTAFIEPLHVIDFVAQVLGKDVHLTPLSDAECIKVCKIVGGQRYSKGLNEKQITSLLKVSCQRPHGREGEILQTIHQNDYNCNPYAKEFGISIDNKLASVEARVLPAPWLKYHDTGRENKILPQIGQWNMNNKACASLEPGYQPPVTFVVVQKRHRTRLFPNNHNDRKAPIEVGISCQVSWWIQRYVILRIVTSTCAVMQEFRILIQMMCAVPPVYYAHLAAYRARFYMESDVHENAKSHATRTNIESVRPLPALKEKVKKVMFHC